MKVRNAREVEQVSELVLLMNNICKAYRSKKGVGTRQYSMVNGLAIRVKNHLIGTMLMLRVSIALFLIFNFKKISIQH